MKYFLLAVSAFIICPAIGQNTNAGKDAALYPSSVIVNKDPRFDEMAAKQAELNKRSQKSGPRRVSGFRIQAANTQDREEANAVKAELLRRFPDQKSYLLYQAPNFRVRIGNFLTQHEALQFRKLIAALYPGKGIYIIPDTVEYTPPAGDDDTQD